jgi:hypothetical protein
MTRVCVSVFVWERERVCVCVQFMCARQQRSEKCLRQDGMRLSLALPHI